MRRFPSLEVARAAFDRYARLEPQLAPLWVMCERAAPPRPTLEESDDDRPSGDEPPCAEETWFAIYVKPTVRALVGPGRTEGPVELCDDDAFNDVLDALLYHAFRPWRPCCRRSDDDGSRDSASATSTPPSPTPPTPSRVGEPPAESRINLRLNAPYRAQAPNGRGSPPAGAQGPARAYARRSRGARDDYSRERRATLLGELVGKVFVFRGYASLHCETAIGRFWEDIVDERTATRTSPDTIAKGALKVWTTSSSWMHELRFRKAQMIGDLNAWTARHRTWLGAPVPITDIRFVLGRPPHPRPTTPAGFFDPTRPSDEPMDREPSPPATEAECAAIREEARLIEDPELRALVERVRIAHNR
jgi:hypothetical protein